MKKLLLSLVKNLTIFFVFLLINSNVSLANTQPIIVNKQNLFMDLSKQIKIHNNAGATLKILTKADRNGIIKRLEIESLSTNPSGNWVEFSLENNSNETIERLLIAPYYNLNSRGIFNSSLDTKHIRVITPSEGNILPNINNNNADIFQITIPANSIITFVGELNNNQLPILSLWEENSYNNQEKKLISYNSILLGISILLILFTSMLAIVKKRYIFVATAITAWSMLFYLCVDRYIFINSLPAALAYLPSLRSLAEFALIISVANFLIANLNIYSPEIKLNQFKKKITVSFLIASILIFITPNLMATITSLLFVIVPVIGLITLIKYNKCGHEYIKLILPAWIILTTSGLFYILTASGILNLTDSQLLLNLLLVVSINLMCFVTIYQALYNEQFSEKILSKNEQLALALQGSGDILWDFDIQANNIRYSSQLKNIMGNIDYPLIKQKWLDSLHPQDRLNFLSQLDTITENNGGAIELALRLQNLEQNYHWFWLKARPLTDNTGKIIRCLGTLIDINIFKHREIELLDAPLYDSGSKLPKIALITERLQSFLTFSPLLNDEKLAFFIVEFTSISAYQRLSPMDLSLIDDYLKKLSYQLQDKFSSLFLGRLSSSQFSFALWGKDQDNILLIEKIINTIENEHNIALHSSTKLFAGAYYGKNLNNAEKIIQQATANLYEQKQKNIKLSDAINYIKSDKHVINNISMEKQEQNIEILSNDIQILATPIKYCKTGKLAAIKLLPTQNNTGMIYAHNLSIDQQPHIPIIMDKIYEEVKKIIQLTNNNPIQESLMISLPILHIDMLSTDYINKIIAKLNNKIDKKISLLLEMDETLFLQHEIACTTIMPQLKQLGVIFSWDNFGSELTPLRYFISLPIDIIQLSHNLKYSTNVRLRSFHHSLVELAYDFGIKIIYKDVDYIEMLNELEHPDDNYVMGKIFGKFSKAENYLLAEKI
ncbi:EAL domain-containing protein [Bartonella sp. DGB1]|uniref:EAL domain-containing protein n=1 Tax=Bartonella sp. DGB1 TaxID=3239807 RepID=UPI00352317F0